MQFTPSRLQPHWLNGLILALLAALYGPLLLHWADGWLNKSISLEHEYFSHGLLGLPYAAYLVWEQRKQWQKLPPQSHPAGFVLLGLGAIAYLIGTNELINASFPLILTGLCLTLKGVPGLKLQAFPLIFTIFATPNAIPYLISPYILPLQSFIAGTAGFILHVLRVPDLTVSGIYLSVRGNFVEVAPHCSGLKMLFTSLYIGGMLLHWTGTWRSRPKVLWLFGGTVIISVVVNILRNTLLAYLYGMDHIALFDWAHEGWGGDLISLVMLMAVVLWLDCLERFDNYFQSGEAIGIFRSGNAGDSDGQ